MATEGEPFCPRCGCLKHSFIDTRKLFKCTGCRHQYSVTSFRRGRSPDGPPQIVNTLSTKCNEIEVHIRELCRQLAAVERDLSSVNAVLAFYDLSPSTQIRFPAYANLNRLFAYGEMFKLCKASCVRQR